MSQCRYFVPDAHMRSAVIVEVDITPYALLCLPNVIEPVPAIDTFRLDNPVGTFCDSIVRRLIVLRHADCDVMFLEGLHL